MTRLQTYSILTFRKCSIVKGKVDWKALDDLLQQDTEQELDNNSEYSEFKEILDGLTNHKAPGKNEVTPDVLEALKGINRERIFIE